MNVICVYILLPYAFCWEGGGGRERRKGWSWTGYQRIRVVDVCMYVCVRELWNEKHGEQGNSRAAECCVKRGADGGMLHGWVLLCCVYRVCMTLNMFLFGWKFIMQSRIGERDWHFPANLQLLDARADQHLHDDACCSCAATGGVSSLFSVLTALHSLSVQKVHPPRQKRCVCVCVQRIGMKGKRNQTHRQQTCRQQQQQQQQRRRRRSSVIQSESAVKGGKKLIVWYLGKMFVCVCVCMPCRQSWSKQELIQKMHFSEKAESSWRRELSPFLTPKERQKEKESILWFSSLPWLNIKKVPKKAWCFWGERKRLASFFFFISHSSLSLLIQTFYTRRVQHPHPRAADQVVSRNESVSQSLPFSLVSFLSFRCTRRICIARNAWNKWELRETK